VNLVAPASTTLTFRWQPGVDGKRRHQCP
jgi:hypothetical protein